MRPPYEKARNEYATLLRSHWARSFADNLRALAGAGLIVSAAGLGGCGEPEDARDVEPPPRTEPPRPAPPPRTEPPRPAPPPPRVEPPAARVRTPAEQQLESSQLARLVGLSELACARLAAAIPPERADAVYIEHEGGVTAERGELCATATDREACRRDVTQALVSRPVTVVLVTTARGAEILRPGAEQPLRDLVTPVDSLERAALAAFFDESAPWCGPATRIREEGGHYEALTFRHPGEGRWCERSGMVTHWILDPGGIPRSLTEEETGVRGFDCHRPVRGRPPTGLTGAPAAYSIASYIARMAYEEAASVVAFRDLAARLEGLGAPRDLVAGCRHAAEQEIRHAELAEACANRLGAWVPALEPLPHLTADLFALAIENAENGCANETYSALLGCYQAARAESEDVRGLMTAIADDEIEHATLSRALAMWMGTRLSAAERHEVECARVAALVRLGSVERDEPYDRAVGVPPRQLRQWMLAHIVAQA